MKNIVTFHTALLVLAAILSTPVNGHHSVGFEYDINTQLTIEGVVREIWFRNPHVRYYVAVTDEEGKKVIWDTHYLGASSLSQRGWMKDTIKLGDRVSITGDATRDGSPKLFIRRLTLPDGRVLGINTFGNTRGSDK